MPDPFAEFGGRAVAPATDDPFAEFGGRAKPPEFSEESGVPLEERTTLKAFAPDVKSQREWLERDPGVGGKPTGFSYDPFGLIPTGGKARAYETAERDGRIYVRPKGEKGPFRALDPNTGAISKDIVGDFFDIGPEVIWSLIPGAKPLQLAAGGAATEAARRGVGQYYGFKDEPVAAAKDIAISGVAGGAAGLATKAVGAGLKKAGGALQKLPEALQKPLKIEKAKTALGKEIGAEQGTRATLREAKVRAHLQGKAAAAEETARAAARKPALEKELLEAEIPTATTSAPKAAAEAGARPAPHVVETLAEGAFPQTARFTFEGSMFDPRTGLSAKALKAAPRVRQLMRDVWGEQFVPEAGSLSMKHRGTQMAGMLQDLPAAEFKRRQNEFFKRAAEFALTSDEAATLSPEAKAALKRVLKGSTEKADQSVVGEVVSAHVGKRPVPAYLTAAKEAHDVQLAKTARSRANYSKIAGPDRPYADFASTWLGGKLIPPALVKPVEWTGRRLASAAGTSIEKLVGLYPKMPKAVQDTISRLTKIHNTRGKAAYKAALFVALKNGLLPMLTE